LLFDQQIKLSTKLSNFFEENKKSGDEIKKDLAHRDVFLCGEIDRLKSYTQEELFKMNENYKLRFDAKANISWIKRILLNQKKADQTPEKEPMFSKTRLTDLCASCDKTIQENADRFSQSHYMNWKDYPNKVIENKPDLYRMTNLGSGYKHIHRSDKSPDNRGTVIVTRTHSKLSIDKPWLPSNRSKSQYDLLNASKSQTDFMNNSRDDK